LVDAVLGIQVLTLAIILPQSQEKATRSPRWLMAGFFFIFAVVEFARTYIAFVLNRNPDTNDHGLLSLISCSAYVVSTSVLPLGFIWMMNSRVEADLLQQNMLDPLTHVLNRRGLRRALEREMELQKERNTPITIAMMDFDHFKMLNDTYGHSAGDTMLIGITQMLRQMLRENDTIARVGGEEFVIVLPETDQTKALSILERLRHEVENFKLKEDGKTLHLTVSFGATVNRAGSSVLANVLLNQADVALYQAKNNGRNCVRFFSAS
jgi:diguanylate cyclase (GGDEF)-like protein